MAKKTKEKINLAQNLNYIIDASDDEFVRGVRGVLKRYKVFLASQKMTHIWSFTPTEVLKKDLDKASGSSMSNDTDFFEINTAYHDDLEEDIKALQHIFIYRINALLEASLGLINKNDYLSSAIICRSLVEQCAVALHHSALIKENYRKLHQDLPINGLSAMIVDLSYVREVMEAGIWGTRLPDILNRGKGIKQFHIIDMMKKIAEKDKYLQPVYEYLCEATHPNAIGNFLFIRSEENDDFRATTSIPISMNQSGDTSPLLVEKTLGAISWSALAVMGVYEQFQSVFLLKKKLFSDHRKKPH